MNVGNLVSYKKVDGSKNKNWSRNGTIMETTGKKWVKVAWPDQVIYDEHIDDLVLVNLP